MRRRWTDWGFALLLFFFAFPLRAQDKTEFFERREVAAQEVLVKFRVATPLTIAQVTAAHDVDAVQTVGGVGVFRFHSRSKGAAALVRELAARSDVVYAEPNYILHAIALPDDPDRKSTRLNSSHIQKSRMPSSA